jgi:hypothetical protein
MPTICKPNSPIKNITMKNALKQLRKQAEKRFFAPSIEFTRLPKQEERLLHLGRLN